MNGDADRRFCRLWIGDIDMTYRVYSGPPGTEMVPPLEKERWLYKEFGLLDEALGWAPR
jgi:hypothetical protein